MRVILTFAVPEHLFVDVRPLQPGMLLGLSRREIEKLPLAVGNREVPLGEVGQIRRMSTKVDELILDGTTSCLIHAGHGMNGGRLAIEGDAGYGAAAGMQAGEIHVRGCAGDCLGMAMEGGLVRVVGSAGDWCGAARPGQTSGMHGGTILVEGNVGAEAGAGMRRGLICAAGDAGAYAGARMLAGTICIGGKAGPGAGMGMKRGSLVAGRLEQILPGFNPTGPADDEWLRIYYVSVSSLGFRMPGGWMAHAAGRFTGDTLELGKGEIIVYDLVE